MLKAALSRVKEKSNRAGGGGGGALVKSPLTSLSKFKTIKSAAGFSDKNEILACEPKNPQTFAEYLIKNPVDRGISSCTQMAISAVNTNLAQRKHTGMLHREGGWPKDINLNDQEHINRYKKKVEKNENYCPQILVLSKLMEANVLQNNAVNIYENYFEGLLPPGLGTTPTYSTSNVYRDANLLRRPVNHLSFSPDRGSKLAVSHCDKSYLKMNLKKSCMNECFIWDIEKPNTPLLQVTYDYAIICLEYNQKDPHNLVSGLSSGQVGCWDLRTGRLPYGVSSQSSSHHDVVNSVLWNTTKLGTEFFSGSSDGQVLWWDCRKINVPLHSLMMDPVKTDNQILSRSYGISVLEYEPSIPTKFMCGTHQGYVFSCNRKGKAPSEKINFKLPCHIGPIQALTRNPFFGKSFLTVGDWVGKIWVEECRESCIISTKHHSAMLTGGAWSTTKSSLFFLTREDGMVDCYDILQKLYEPLLSIKVCDSSILSIKPHENGKMIAVGNAKGATHLIELSESMQYNNKNDKIILTSMFERETKREKILETKHREFRLKFRSALKILDDDQEHPSSMNSNNTQQNVDEILACCVAEKEMFDNIELEKRIRNNSIDVCIVEEPRKNDNPQMLGGIF